VAPDPNDPRPPYLQVADDLRTAIAAGSFQAGQRLPSSRELARRYGVAPMTIHHAVGVLRDERLVVSYQGRGVFVANHTNEGKEGRSKRAQPGQGSAIQGLRSDLDQLADRVTRLERLVREERGTHKP
jgi:DNA-binding GntR family transcriptional regulator